VSARDRRSLWRDRVGLLLLALLALGLVRVTQPLPARAAVFFPSGTSRANPLPSPGAFALRSSHGYTIGITAEPASEGRPDRVLVQIVGSSGDATYIAPARLDGEGIRADLGIFGKVNMKWHPNGRVGRLPIKCKRYRSLVYVAEGAYTGSVRIVGENDFTTATATRVRGRTGWYRIGGCDYFTSEGFPGPGILLEASIFESRLPEGSYRYLSVVQNRPHERVSYFAASGEQRGRLSIGRRAYALGRPKTLIFGNRLDTGAISPPAPFSGTGTFERIARRRPGRWRGNLTVDFPGRPNVSLTGKDFGAQLMHGYRETESARLMPNEVGSQ
jgi:hypothetical protein